MDGITGIVDVFKYNILIQKIKENDYYGLLWIILGYLVYSMYNRFQFHYKELYILLYRLKNNNYKYRSSITLEGQYVTKHTSYTVKMRTLMSDNFKAIWQYIIKKDNKDVYSILECHNEELDDYEKFDDLNNDSLFIIDQELPFLLDKDIFCIVETYKGDDEDNNKNSNIKVQTKHISLTIFSFLYKIDYLKDYLENIKNNYLKSIEDKRKYMTFYYKLKNIDSKEQEINWYEKELYTNKTFNKLYIKNKNEILDKINFFLNNKSWYEKEGHPYTLGIGLHGPPGTGKTSFIKSLAKMTNRHIIEISLSKITSENDLFDVFYDNKYHKYNKEPIEFKDKIIIFEDIDCMDDIVLKREYKHNNEKNKEYSEILNALIQNDSDDNDEKPNFKKSLTTSSSIKYTSSNSLTLSSLLNIMDGVSEDDGRILIMTSNHWSKLDPALVRPGRIDIEVEMGHIDEETLNNYVYDHYKKKIPKSKMRKINFENITPCIMINQYVNAIDFDDYINKLYKY